MELVSCLQAVVVTYSEPTHIPLRLGEEDPQCVSTHRGAPLSDSPLPDPYPTDTHSWSDNEHVEASRTSGFGRVDYDPTSYLPTPTCGNDSTTTQSERSLSDRPSISAHQHANRGAE